MLTVYGRATSLNVQAVMWSVAELDLAHERLDSASASAAPTRPSTAR